MNVFQLGIRLAELGLMGLLYWYFLAFIGLAGNILIAARVLVVIIFGFAIIDAVVWQSPAPVQRTITSPPSIVR